MHLFIHDGARCLATPELFERCGTALQTCSGLIAAIPVKDTIKVVDQNGLILDTPNRQQLWAAQTPQGFEVKLLKECHDQGRQQGWEVTDDAALFEKCGGNMQSPINIDQTALIYDSSLGPFSFSNYDKVLNFTMINDGETGK